MYLRGSHAVTFQPGTTSNNLFILKNGASAEGVYCNTTNQFDWTGVCFLFNDMYTDQAHTTLKKIKIVMQLLVTTLTNGYGTGIQIQSTSSSQSEAFIVVDDVHIYGGEYGVLLTSTSTGLTNGNLFSNIHSESQYGFALITTAGGAVSGNMFTNCSYQYQGAGTCAFYLNGNATGYIIANTFSNFVIWDTPSPNIILNTYTENNVFLGWNGTSSPLGISDSGTGNIFFSPYYANLANLNGVLYASKFSGSDLGAQINSMITYGISTGLTRKYIIDVAGTITTPIVGFPIGSVVDVTAGVITLASTWPINHRGCVFNFNGCQLNYNQDSGNAAILVGKNVSGTVNTSGTAVTWASGTKFSTLDPGDNININGSSYNVASVTDSTHLVLDSSAGSNTGVAFGCGFMGSFIGGVSYPQGTRIRDLCLAYTGAGTNASNVGVLMSNVDFPYMENCVISAFISSAGGYGMKLLGVLLGTFYQVKVESNYFNMFIDEAATGGVTVTSNVNNFVNCVFNNASCGAGNPAVSINNGCFQTSFRGCDFEGNNAAYTILINNGAYLTSIESCDFEVNGNAIVNSTDILIQDGPDTTVYKCQFVGGASHTPDYGIVGNSGSVRAVIKDNYWDPNSAYNQAAVQLNSGASAWLVNNNPNGATIITTNALVVWDISGNLLGATLSASGATPTGSGSILGLGNTTGFGNGSAGTAVTTTTKSTGSGPATPQTVVSYLKVTIGSTVYWLPMVQ